MHDARIYLGHGLSRVLVHVSQLELNFGFLPMQHEDILLQYSHLPSASHSFSTIELLFNLATYQIKENGNGPRRSGLL
jgi:hypothetical protein